MSELVEAARALPGASNFVVHWAHARLWRDSQTAPGIECGVLEGDRLVVAGDWSYGGGVEAAWRAGMAAAAKLAA